MDAQVGNYSIGGRLGEGTFGTVLKATHTIAGERVAVKVLEKKRMQQADDIERVGREIQILKQLKHPHVVRLWEIIYAADRIYLVMEYAAKGELFQYIVKQGRLREDEGRRFFNQIVAGVSYLHQNNVVHRDIKPENLLMSGTAADGDAPPPTLKLCDFGASRYLVEKDADNDAAGGGLTHYVGSRWYRAPELMANRTTYDELVDVWSCGTIVAEMATGEALFQGNDEAEV